VKVTRFDRARDLIFVGGRVWGPHGSPAPLRLDELGYNPRQAEAITMMRSAVGREEG